MTIRDLVDFQNNLFWIFLAVLLGFPIGAGILRLIDQRFSCPLFTREGLYTGLLLFLFIFCWFCSRGLIVW